MGKTYKHERKERKERSGILLGMILSGKTTKILGDRRDKRNKDERKSWRNEEW